MLIPRISMIQMRASARGNKRLLFSGMRTQKHYGMIMGLFQISRYVPTVSSPLIAVDVPQPFTMRFPRADIHELLTCHLLHQVIKGTFKDHLVEWVKDYLKKAHGPSKGNAILDEIDRRYVKHPIPLIVLNILQHCTRASLSWPPEVQTRPQLQTMDRQ